MRWGGNPPFNYERWHKWFAWYPVKCGGEAVWLEVIERKEQWSPIGNFWMYRFPETPVTAPARTRFVSSSLGYGGFVYD